MGKERVAARHIYPHKEIQITSCLIGFLGDFSVENCHPVQGKAFI